MSFGLDFGFGNQCHVSDLLLPMKNSSGNPVNEIGFIL